MNEINKLQKENAKLKAENERLKEKIESYICSQNCYAYKQADRYRQTLQEIKAIVCGNYEIIDTQGRKDILKLMTKAESEDNQ